MAEYWPEDATETGFGEIPEVEEMEGGPLPRTPLQIPNPLSFEVEAIWSGVDPDLPVQDTQNR